jgi:hypothetical protein
MQDSQIAGTIRLVPRHACVLLRLDLDLVYTQSLSGRYAVYENHRQTQILILDIA